MKIAGATVLVTGANRGLGKRFVSALEKRGAARIYACARNPASIEATEVVVPLRLDVTDTRQVSAVVEAAGDLMILINNAGSNTGASLLGGDLADIRLEFETHFFGPLALIREFAPVLARGGGGAVLNVLSVRSWISSADEGAYSAAKAAAWAMSNSLRLALAPQGTRLTALYAGFMDTDMVANVTGPKSDPMVIAGLALDGLEQGRHEVVADERSRTVRAKLSGELTELYPQLAESATAP